MVDIDKKPFDRSKFQSEQNIIGWNTITRARRIAGIKKAHRRKEYHNLVSKKAKARWADDEWRAANDFRPKGTLAYAPLVPVLCACGCGEFAKSKGAKYLRGHCNFDPVVKQKQSVGQAASYMSGKRKRARGRDERVKTKKSGKVWCRSSWETAFVQILDSSSLVVKFIVEPFRIPFKFEGVVYTYIPDFYVKLKDGREFLIETRAQFRAQMPRSLAQFRAANSYCEARGIEFRVFMHQIESVSEMIQ